MITHLFNQKICCNLFSSFGIFTLESFEQDLILRGTYDSKHLYNYKQLIFGTALSSMYH